MTISTASLIMLDDHLIQAKFYSVSTSHLSASITTTPSGKSAFVAGTGISIVSGTIDDQIIISNTALPDTNPSFLVLANTSSLLGERSFVVGTGLRSVDGGANSTYTVSVNDSIIATVSGTAFTGPLSASIGAAITGTLIVSSSIASAQISGTLTQTAAGNSYLVAGPGITIASGTSNQVFFSNASTQATIHTPPLIPNQEDEEFLGIGFPSSSWGIVRHDNTGTITVTGSIDSFSGSINPNIVRWEVGYRNSCLTVQPTDANGNTNNIHQLIYRPLFTTVQNSGSTPWCFYTRINPVFGLPASGGQPSVCTVRFGLAVDGVGGKPDLTKLFWLHLDHVHQTAASDYKARLFYGQYSGAGLVEFTNNLRRTPGMGGTEHVLFDSPIDTFGVFHIGNGLCGAFVGSENQLQVLSNATSNTQAIFGGTTQTFKYVFISFHTDNFNSLPTDLYHIDYIRKTAGRLP